MNICTATGPPPTFRYQFTIISYVDDRKLQILIRKSAEGNEEAFEELLAVVVPILYKDLTRYLDNKHDIDDILQESIWKIWSSIDRVDTTSEPLAFFRKITYNTLMSFFRKKKNQEIYIPPEDFLYIGDESYENQETSSSDLSDELRNLLSELPARYQQALTLRYIEEKEYGEIARIMNVSEATARQLVSRGLKKLKKLAGDKHGKQ
ncbi:sigma-70 family RNA polymerase sigma factor [bacterium 3DAC]|nr:sigma-70 family RNA polymerase sigma factor [bacterium 3DAC]